jgi:HEAT repeats
MVGAILLCRAPEPSYQGKSLTAWMDDFARLTTPYTGRGIDLKFTDAFHAMGSNCIPLIFKRLERQDSVLRTKYRSFWPRLPKALQKILPTPGPVLSAVPVALLIDSFGQTPFPLLLSELGSRSSTARQVAITRLHPARLTPDQIDQVDPVMIARLSDTNAATRLYAAGFLGERGPKASKAVPALVLALRLSDTGPAPFEKWPARVWVATALGKMGPTASSALPALTGLITDPDSYVRWKAAAAIWQISSNVETSLPILVQELPASLETWTLVEVLGEMGPRARDAIPALEKELEKVRSNPRAYSELGQNITNALLKIDPESAARLGIKK